MSDDDQSEDGQLRSPDLSPGDDTTDSLDIKPPQAARIEYPRYKTKKSGKEKKHSKEHRHRLMNEREHGKDREERHRRHRSERERIDGRQLAKREMRYEQNPFYRDSREQQLPPPQQHYGRNVVYKDREREKVGRNERERDRRMDNSPKSDADKILEDLRTRLLSKKNKHESESKPANEEHYEHSKSKQKRKERKDFVEVIDSPEHFVDYHPSSSKQTKEKEKEPKHKPAEDKEQEARRSKLLEADREMARRKEVAREELEARRILRREREETIISSESPEVKRKKFSSDDEAPEEVEEEEQGNVEESNIVNVSDQSEHDTNSDSDSSSVSVESPLPSEDDEAPISPLSVGEISKSERQRRSPSRSRSGSRYRYDSKSRSPTRSKSRSGSRSPSHSPPTRNHSRSRSIERSDDDDYDDDESKHGSPTKPKEESDKTPEPIEDEKDALPPYFPGIQGCRSVEEFQCLNRIEEGTYGVVYRAKDKRTEEIVALKRLKMEKEKEGFPITSLREINTLLKGQHPNIVTVREIVVGSNMDKIFIVMDYVEHDLKSLMETMKHKKQVFLPGEVKCLTQQLLRAVAHLHDNWILHRDLKTSNLLLSHKGILKVGDFGLAREYGSPLKAYTSIVVTLWYRAPELLLCCKEYSTPIDIWSVGCIFAEFLSMMALFPGKTEIDQLNRMFKDLGTPNEKIWPGYGQLPAVQKMTFTEYPVSNLRKKFSHLTSELGMSLLQGLLTYDPKQRLSAEAALKHSYFKELPLPIDPAMFPTWPAKSELGLKKALASSPKPPSGGGEFKKLGDDVVTDNQGFHLGGTYAESRQMAMGPGFSLKF